MGKSDWSTPHTANTATTYNILGLDTPVKLKFLLIIFNMKRSRMRVYRTLLRQIRNATCSRSHKTWESLSKKWNARKTDRLDMTAINNKDCLECWACSKNVLQHNQQSLIFCFWFISIYESASNLTWNWLAYQNDLKHATIPPEG